MPTLFEEPARLAVLQRLGRLTPASAPRWGRMNAAQMLAHCAAQLRLGLGELPCVDRRLPFRYFPLKQLIVYLLPFPRGVPTAAELVVSDEREYDAEHQRLTTLIARFGASGARREFPPHPAFGRLSRRAWGVLAYRHLDHHLRQFGV